MFFFVKKLTNFDLLLCKIYGKGNQKKKKKK